MLTKIIDEGLIQKAKHILGNADKVAVIGHLGPDGDALGACLAMTDYLVQRGKKVQVMLPDEFPAFLNWLPDANKTLIYTQQPEACETFLKKADAIFLLDLNQLNRIGGLAETVGALKAPKVLIDHHPNPDQFTDVTISYPQFASTSEMVFRFICRSGYFDEMTKDCAICVYTGMMTDTGAFTYNSNNEEMYYIISQLIHKGVDKDWVYNKVFNTYSVDRMRLMGFVLYNRMQIWDAYHTAIITLTKEDLNEFDYQVGDTEGFVNLPLSIKDIVFSVFIREDEDKIKLSFRSRGAFPCNKVASNLFNGGGHLNAAGGEFYGKMDEAVKLLEEWLPDFMI